MSEARGWPFLIGAGRRHEYRTLVAPGFLAEYGLLDRHAGRLPDGESRVVEIRPDLWIVYAAHTVHGTRDEHNRPLRVLAGFATEVPIDRLDPSDLATALDAGMPWYERYLADEERFGVVASEPFPLRSVPVAAPPAPPRRLIPLVLAGLAVVVVAVVALVIGLAGGDRTPACGPPSAEAASTAPPSAPPSAQATPPAPPSAEAASPAPPSAQAASLAACR